MIQSKKIDIDLNEIKSFDVKEYVLKVISHWKLFLAIVILGLLIAFYYNMRRPRIYSLDSIITVKEEQNPLFTSSTNIAFNWGGPSDQVETIITVLNSRTHNEKVVKALKYYIGYWQEGRFRMVDVYGQTPFHLELDTVDYQLQNVLLKLEFQKDNQLQLSVRFDEDEYNLSNYSNFLSKQYIPNKKNWEQQFSIFEDIETPFCNFKLIFEQPLRDYSGEVYYITFANFNSTVASYQTIDAQTMVKGTSLIRLQMAGTNKKRLEDYINTTVEVLDQDQQKQKIEYAIRTKQYIDTVFTDASKSLQNIEQDLGNYKRENNIYDLSVEGNALFAQAQDLDKEEQDIQNRLSYYRNLESYIRSANTIGDDIPVPVSVSIEDANITKNITELVELSKQKKNLEQTVKEDYPPLKSLNDKIDITRDVVLENLSNLKDETKNNLNNIKQRLGSYNARLQTLPKKEQGLVKLQRTYGLTSANYEYLKQKQYEAGTAIAANVSDIKILDKAKDVGQGPISPNTRFNYLVALMLSFGIPFLFILVKEALNNKILTVEEIEKLYDIPVLGVVGTSKLDSYLAVFEKPKSTLAESFRALRSNIQFLFKKGEGSKTIVVTSSVSGEGKTLCSINMASVFAMSEKKTILIGMDLRKPKLHDDFGISNNVGVVNYLIGQKSLEEVIQKTKITNLDIITSGPTPPNPSELILSEQTAHLMEQLKKEYDYIVIDTPPVGLVADSIELFSFSDAIMYIIRQNYTERGMPKMIHDKYKSGEVKNISFVFNDFSVKDAYGYGYGGYGYGYGGYGYGKYGEGYHSNDKKISKLKKWFSKL